MLPVVGAMLAERRRSVLYATLTAVGSLVPYLFGAAGLSHLIGAVALGGAFL